MTNSMAAMAPCLRISILRPELTKHVSREHDGELSPSPAAPLQRRQAFRRDSSILHVADPLELPEGRTGSAGLPTLDNAGAKDAEQRPSQWRQVLRLVLSTAAKIAGRPHRRVPGWRTTGRRWRGSCRPPASRDSHINEAPNGRALTSIISIRNRNKSSPVETFD